MVKTGYISFITESEGGFDANGDPIAATKVNSDYFDCNLKVVNKEYKTMIDGQYQQASYSTYMDWSLVSEIDIKVKTEVQLQDNNGNDLGVFQIQNVEYLNLTNRVKLVV